LLSATDKVRWGLDRNPAALDRLARQLRRLLDRLAAGEL